MTFWRNAKNPLTTALKFFRYNGNDTGQLSPVVLLGTSQCNGVQLGNALSGQRAKYK